MKLLKRISCFFKKSLWFNLLVFILIVATIGLGVKYLLRKEKWLEVEIWGNAGEWWWETEAPPYWIANAIEVGDVEYDAGGKKVGEIIEVKKFSKDEGKQFLLKVKLKVDVNNETGTMKYVNSNLEIGSTLTLRPGNKVIVGNVLWIEGLEDKRQKKDLIIGVDLYEKYPWEAEAFKVGDQMTDEGNNVIAEVLDKQVNEHRIKVTTDNGDVLVRFDPLTRDIFLKIKIQTTEVAGQAFFAGIQEVKVANEINIMLPRYNIDKGLISSIKED